jgi:hypothetical protein
MTRARLFAALPTAAVLTLAGLTPIGALLAARPAEAQSFPVVGGTQELQIGVSMVSLPEITNGSWSAQPEVRWGLFLADGLELQVGLDTRVWPLGSQAPKSYGGGVSMLWFPDLGTVDRNFYLLAGAAGMWSDPPQAAFHASFDPVGRGGMGLKVPLDNLGLGFLAGKHLTVEYRLDFVLLNEDEEDYAVLGDVATNYDFLSGLAVGVSFIL